MHSKEGETRVIKQPLMLKQSVGRPKSTNGRKHRLLLRFSKSVVGGERSVFTRAFIRDIGTMVLL